MFQSRSALSSAIRFALVASMLPAVSLAQDNAADADEAMVTLDTIKVTARKREEELRDVPLSITAVGAEKIEKLGLESINDIAKIAPGFSFRSAFGREGDRPVIRGQSNIQGDPNASFFIDGVFVSGSISGYNLDNLERVEVIRGPQSALFGRGTFSGAVNFITKRPTNEPQMSVSVTAAEDSEREFSGNAAGVLVDDLLKFQFNARYYQYGGQFVNATTGIKDMGGQRSASAGGTLYFTPTESWESTLRFNVTSDEDEHYAIARIGDPLNLVAEGLNGATTANYINNVLNCFRPTLTGAIAANLPVASGRTRGYICGTLDVPRVFAANTTLFENAGFKPGLDRYRERYSWANDFTTEGGWTFSSISSFNKSRGTSAVDQDFSSNRGFTFAPGSFETIDFTRRSDFSQELRLTSPADQPLRGIAGVYYYRESGQPGFSTSLSGFPARVPVRNPTRPGGGIRNNSVFGMIEYDWTDALTTTAELRLAEDTIRLSGVSSFTSNINPTISATRSFDLRSTNKEVLPRVTVKYDLTDTMNVYALAAKGNKPGGFNTAIQGASLIDTATDPSFASQTRSALLARGLASFDEETAWTYELGYKAGFLDDAISLSAALYFIDWTNQQLTETATARQIDNTELQTSFTTNLGESSIKGLELEADWRISENLSANVGYTHTSTNIDSYISQDIADLQNCGRASFANGCGSAEGNELPRAAPYQANVGVSWNDQLSNGWGYSLSGRYSYEASRFGQIENLNETGGCTDVGLRAGLQFDAHLSATIFVRNATDDVCVEDILRYVNPALRIRVPTLTNPAVTESATLRDFVITPSRMRQAGITLNYRF